MGSGHLSGEILQQASQCILRLNYEGGSAILATLAPSVPAAAHVKSVSLDGKAVKFSVRDFGSFVRVEVAPIVLQPSAQVVLTINYDGGIGIVPPAPHPQSGESTSSLKILGVEANTQNPRCLVRLDLAGLAGRTYMLPLISTLPNLQSSGFSVSETATGYTLQIPFEGSASGSSSGYVTREVCVSN
jgi:hypothetical protein